MPRSTDLTPAIVSQSSDCQAPFDGQAPPAGGSPGETVAAADRQELADDRQRVDWTTAMKRAIRSQRELRRFVGLWDANDVAAEDAAGKAIDLAERFPTFVPLEFARRIRRADPLDPLLRQVLASEQENQSVAGFVSDPVGDLNAAVGGGVLHKYAGRALIVTHGACAVHCRYCFRREFPYSEQASRRTYWKPALDYVRQTPSVVEVLLSGGDPLTLTDSLLDQLIGEIEAIAHVRRLRIHTRLPIVIPQRITNGLLDRLAISRLGIWIVVHTNHAQEIDDHVADAFNRIRGRGIALLNQAVLLAGVNDDVDALADLSDALINLGVHPYYLHQLDRVRGASHFWVDVERGKQLIEELRGRLPGYAVPRYVVEQAGAKSKTPIA